MPKNSKSQSTPTNEQNQSFVSEISSEFSLSQLKKSQRCRKNKKITKIVHTYCFLIKTSEGKLQTVYYQKLAESSTRDQNGLNKAAQKQRGQNEPGMIKLAKERAGLPQTNNRANPMVNPLDNHQPLVPFFLHNHFYLVC